MRVVIVLAALACLTPSLALSAPEPLSPMLALHVRVDRRGKATLTVHAVDPRRAVCLALPALPDGTALDDPFVVTGTDGRMWTFVDREEGRAHPPRVRLPPGGSAVFRVDILRSYRPPPGAARSLQGVVFAGSAEPC